MKLEIGEIEKYAQDAIEKENTLLGGMIGRYIMAHGVPIQDIQIVRRDIENGYAWYVEKKPPYQPIEHCNELISGINELKQKVDDLEKILLASNTKS